MYGITQITRKQLKQHSEKRTNFNGLKQKLQIEGRIMTELSRLVHDIGSSTFNKWGGGIRQYCYILSRFRI